MGMLLLISSKQMRYKVQYFVHRLPLKYYFPEFPDNCQIKKMECLQNMPNLAGIYAERGLARYMIQCRLIYFEKETGA